MEKKLIIGNWKMNGSRSHIKQFCPAFLSALSPNFALQQVGIAAPYVYIDQLSRLLPDNIMRGAQNCFHQPQGAYTGEISLPMLDDIGCHFVILGHCERRQFFGEASCEVAQKVDAALSHPMLAIVCIGETLEEKKSGRTKEVLTQQVKESLPAKFSSAHLVIAYEPVWAIGTGKAPTTHDIAEAKVIIAQALSLKSSSPIRFLYGGSVTPDNARDILLITDGVLVGGASLDPLKFAEICHAAL